MSRRKPVRVMTGREVHELFAWPFKVLHDLFHNPPSVADPEFTPFDINALRSKLVRPSRNTRKSTFFSVDRARLPFLVWLIVMVVVTLFGLIIL